ncbi:hypothetical protein [Acidiphilium sp.]|uniref:hypothetical protein n=1 Tax=Acidiphilium sp. TaxID=527 RepID=UPI00258D4212|nr:hypothetical protein [Acidiphilium sp.]
MSDRDLTDEEIARKAALQAELDSIGEAEAALQNSAITEYFNEVERRAVDTLLDCDMLDDAMRLKLTIVAQTTRKLRQYLHEKRDMRRFVEEEIKALTGADDA